jgi:uncharacterized protein YggE
LITVNGEVSMTVPATKLTLHIPTATREKDAATARRAADAKLAAMKKALPASVEIVVYDGGLSPEVRGSEVIAQTLSRTISVTFNDLTHAEDDIGTALKHLGVVGASGQLIANDPVTAAQKASITAAKNARDRATLMVEALGGKLGLPRTVSESVSAPPSVSFAVTMAEGVVKLGKLELPVSAHVSVQFDIRDE